MIPSLTSIFTGIYNEIACAANVHTKLKNASFVLYVSHHVLVKSIGASNFSILVGLQKVHCTIVHAMGYYEV